MRKYPHFLFAGLRTAANVVVYALTRGRLLYLEGRWRRGEYHNWSHDRRHRAGIVRPASEAELVEAIRTEGPIRVVGAGHSFNDGLATGGVNVSLDRLAGVVHVDRVTGRVTAWAGTRLRDLNRALLAEGLAIACLASHDAQSVAGIVSTDVHGSGRGPAHLSDALVGLRIVDASGQVHAVGPGDDLFRAAVGGIGAVGVISQVTIQCVDAFDLRQSTFVETREWAEAELHRLHAANEHVSFYAYPFTPLVHVHTWRRTAVPRSFAGPLREFFQHAAAAMSVSFLGDWYAHRKRLPDTVGRVVAAQPSSGLVLRSHDAFNRTLYHLHQELELTVPAEDVWRALDRALRIYEDLYDDHDLPFLLVEVRFTPAGHEAGFLGAGIGRASAWLCLCCNQSGDVGAYFDAVEEWMATSDHRAHLGKWCERWTADDLARWHGTRFERFRAVRARHDPEGRFVNAFTERVLGPVR
jgi:L-gulono-1,4-lactone dehydrogenase